MKQVDVVLVHGTFAPNSAWTQPNSAFRKNLSELCNTNDVELRYTRFLWSGSNCHEARAVASDAFVSFFQKLRAESNHDAIVIAHSHGANVVRKALDALSETELPNIVVTYGAPFLQFKPRNRLLVRFFSLLFAAVVAFLGPVLLFLSLELFGVTSGNGRIGNYFWGSLPFGVLVFLWLRREFEKVRLRLGSFAPLDTHKVSFLCFSSFGDEAGLLLKMWGGVHLISFVAPG